MGFALVASTTGSNYLQQEAVQDLSGYLRDAPCLLCIIKVTSRLAIID
jgi:hypothetical protein